MQRFFRGAILAVVLGAALATATSASAASINWGTCSDPALKALHAQCGDLSVPLDYAAPGGPQIQLAVSIIRHTSTAKNYQGVILTNPGGPGASGLDLGAFLVPVLRQEGFKAAANDYDWIGFDPRGVGASVPAVRCDPNYFGPDRPNYIPKTQALVNFWLAKSNLYANACQSASPQQAALLRNVTTRDSARDMDSIRQALGQDQINYYGFSYGTYLGQVYSTMFPTHVRRLIMDSNVDPRNVWYQANLGQDFAFNRNENIWFGWLAKYDSVYHLGASTASVRQLFYSTERALGTEPAGGGQVGPDEWVDVFLSAGYNQSTWPDEAKLFADWVHNHDTAAAANLVAAYQADDGVGDDNGYAIYDAVQCTDVQWPTSWATWQSDNWAVYHRAPFLTWNNAWFNAPCLYWPAPAHTPATVNGTGIRSALLIDETLDAATPFEGSLFVRQLFPNSVLVAEPGGTNHADSLSGDVCVDGTIAAYLQSGALPARRPNAKWDKTCAPLPRPVPTSAAAPTLSPKPAPLGLPAKLAPPAVELR